MREWERVLGQTLPHAGFSVSIDLADPTDLHPPFKCEVGRRLALAARQGVYGEKVLTSPTVASWNVQGDKVLIKFTNAGDGLKIGAPPKGSKASPPSTSEIKGFAVAGSDRVFHWAKAAIEGPDIVVVSCPEVKTPLSVRYGWGADPEVNLYNSADLPASPFSTDPPPAGKAVASPRTNASAAPAKTGKPARQPHPKF